MRILNACTKIVWKLPEGTTYMYKQDLVLNNLQWLICHKTKPNQTGTTTSGQSGPESNGNEEEVYTSQIFKTEA